mmetsp:Transcript_132/g.299  ORF Transcript_132/g.299 Transcript_132/m.299 type:complete len:96 (-) Transcript_132:68-355(-)
MALWTILPRRHTFYHNFNFPNFVIMAGQNYPSNSSLVNQLQYLAVRIIYESPQWSAERQSAALALMLNIFTPPPGSDSSTVASSVAPDDARPGDV